MSWIIYALGTGLLPVLFFLAIFFLILGYSGRLGDWATVRETKRRSALVVGYLCLVFSVLTINAIVILMYGGGGTEFAMASSPTELPTPTSSPTQTTPPTATLDPILLVLGTPTTEGVFTPTPLFSATPTQPPLDASRQCGATFIPPCTYTLNGETNMLAVARSVTRDDDQAILYAGLIRNLVRDEYGFVAPTPREVRVPDAAVPVDLAYYQYYFSNFGWTACSEPAEPPCIYVVPPTFILQDQERDYAAIARLFFPKIDNAAKCIKDANTYIHRGGDVYAPVEIEPGVTLIIPNILAPGRESCRNQ